MRSRRRRGSGARTALAALALVALAAVPALVPPAAATEPEPAIVLDRSHALVGETVVVTLTGWPGRAVTLSLCGNAAARGSSDCDVVGSLGVGLARSGDPTLSEFGLGQPPGTCPCVVRATSPTHDHVATAPITLVGVPTGPVVEPEAETPLAVAVEARPADMGLLAWIRSNLGGPTPYEVTVTVENRSGAPVRNLAVTGAAARRGRDDVAVLALEPPAELGPGETWEQVSRATLPAPVWGKVVWALDASGSGPVVGAEATTRWTPVVLVVLVALLVVDLVALVVRTVLRRRRRAEAGSPEGDAEGVRPDVAVPSPAAHV